MSGSTTLAGRLILGNDVAGGVITVHDGLIAAVDLDPGAAGPGTPYIAPGYIDVHVHGWGGHAAMGGPDALDGMARALLRRGVTSFLPSAWSEPLATIRDFTDTVRAWMPSAPADGAAPLGFNLEGPFLAEARKGAHDPAHLVAPADVRLAEIESWVEGLRLITIAPELRGALELIGWLRERGVTVSLGHSAATLPEARAGYAAGATTTTHLFNAMTGVDHRAPGLAVAALTHDDAWVELIADGLHVDRALWQIVERTKPRDRLLLVSDAIPLAGTGDGRARVGGLEVEIVGGLVTLVGTTTLAGSVIALDTAVRNLIENGASVAAAVAAASANPAAMLGVTDRGRIAVGLRADLVELDDDFVVRRVMLAGAWSRAAG